MRPVLGFAVAVSLAVGGMAVASLAGIVAESPAQAQTKQKSGKPSQKPRGQRRSVPHTTGFEHQQCTVQDPCSTRNQW